MNEMEKTVGAKLAAAFDALPPGGKEYLIGYADGVAAMKARAAEEDEQKSA